MKYNRFKVLAAMLAASTTLMGCGSIMLNANLDKAKIEDYIPKDANGNSYFYDGTQTTVPEALGTKLMLQADRKKYAIGGTDAFYLLPCGVPVPEGLVSFKVLDFIDDTTTVYAYQTIYQDADSSGLGEMPESGIAKDYEEVLSADNMNQMVTILMTYNTKTREYRVLFHQVDNVDVKIRPYNDNGEEMSMRDHLVITKDGRDIKEVGSCFSQKLSNGKYTIYYDGISHVYSPDGKLEYEFNIIENLKMHGYLNQILAGYDHNYELWWLHPIYTYPEFTITNVVMDNNYFLYVLMTVENPGKTVDKDTDESDLEDQGGEGDSGGSAVNQQLVTFFNLDLSTYTAQNGQWVRDDSKYFVSEDLSFDARKSAWERSAFQAGAEEMESGNPVYDVGEVGEDTEITEEDLVFIVRNKYHMPTAEDMQLQIGNYTPFEFHSTALAQDLKIQLYASKVKATEDINDAIKRIGSETVNQVSHLLGLKGLTPDLVGESQKVFTETRVFGKFPDKEVGGKQYQGKVVVLPRNIGWGRQNLIREDIERKYRVRYHRLIQEAEENEDGTETPAEYEDVEVPIVETYSLIKEYQLELVNANAQWSEDRVTSDMIAPSAGSGIIRYNTSKKSDYEDGAWACWQLANDMTGIDEFKDRLIEGKAKNCMLFMDKNKPVIALLTDEQTAFFTNFADYVRVGSTISYRPSPVGQNIVRIPNGKLYFGLSAEEDLLASMEKIRNNPEYSQNQKEQVEYTSSDTLGVMMETGMRFSNSYVYIASSDSGLVKVNLSETGEQRGGQVSPYPYFGVWLNDEETMADVIGFQSDEYEYNNEDISRAKLYKMPLLDRDAAVNLVLSALQKDSELEKKILNGDDETWKKLLAQLGLNRKEADLGQISRYYEFLKSGKKSQDNAVLQFYQLAGISNALRTEKLRNRILECKYKTDLEELMWELRPDILNAAGQKPVSAPTIADITDVMEELSSEAEEASKGESASQTTAAAPTKVDLSKNKELDTSAVQEVEGDQEGYRDHQSQVGLVTEYLQEKAGKTQDEWNTILTNLIDALHPTSSLAEYEKKMALKDFAVLAGYQVQPDMATKIKACTSVEQLKKVMAWYYLSSTTRAALQQDAEAKIAAKEEAEKKETSSASGTTSDYEVGAQANMEFTIPEIQGNTELDSDGKPKRQMTAEELKQYREEQTAEKARKLKEAQQELNEAFEKYCKPSIIEHATIVTGAGTVKQADQNGFGNSWNVNWETWLAEKLLTIQKTLKTE